MNSHRNNVLIFFSVFFLISTSVLINAARRTHSVEEHWSREFGVGIVAYEDMPFIDTIYSNPDVNAEITAVLNKRELCFTAPADTCVFSYERMIEYDYEIAGFAILSFSVDSSWAEVTLDPWSKTTSQTGWVRLNEPKAVPRLWTEILPGRNPLFFMNPDSIRVFEQPDYTYETEISLVVYDNSKRLDYEMRPLAVKGRWMQVEVVTPSQYCKSPPPESNFDTLWIEYLSKSLRPRVFYYTRGC